MDEFQGGSAVSPGGFIFGVQGFVWGTPIPKSITFFIDNTAMVCDQHGRSIRGVVNDSKEVKFAITPPRSDGTDASLRNAVFATHAQVVALLGAENIDWKKLTCAGWPQLPYAQLKEMKELPPTPIDELRKIRDPKLRQDALKVCRERDERHKKEYESSNKEE